MFDVIGNLTSSLRKLKNDRRGIVEKIVEVGVAVMVVVTISLAIAYFSGAIPTISDPVANESITSSLQIGWQSISILMIAVLVGAVMTIVAVVMGVFYFRGNNGGRGR